MAESHNIDELELLNTEILLRGIIEKTKDAKLVWAKLTGADYKATITDSGTVWTYNLARDKSGENYMYTLDILKGTALNSSIKEEDVGEDSRSTGVEELYQVVESIVLDLRDSKLKEANKVIFNL